MSSLVKPNIDQPSLLGLAIEIQKLIGAFIPANGEACVHQKSIFPVADITTLKIYPGRPGFGQSTPMIWSEKRSRSLDGGLELANRM